MVELERGAKIRQMMSEGWTKCLECIELRNGDPRIGGPTYLRAPDQRIWEITLMTERPLNGFYSYMGKQRVYRDGRPVGSQG